MGAGSPRTMRFSRVSRKRSQPSGGIIISFVLRGEYPCVPPSEDMTNCELQVHSRRGDECGGQRTETGGTRLVGDWRELFHHTAKGVSTYYKCMGRHRSRRPQTYRDLFWCSLDLCSLDLPKSGRENLGNPKIQHYVIVSSSRMVVDEARRRRGVR